ncbi:unnamed protein product [Heligmosomoides polygyrus]|uniref:Saposin B-type domain-containing protein n=1 Tax=Heligmosomoides polygyrus TaxID=6339 RepID=A0A3P7ZJY4_HELPZ|nr:unnamed protein product [Heligmosomoides polygyrus]
MEIFDERLVDRRIREIVKFSDNQCGFVAGFGTIDAIHAACLLVEKHREKQKRCISPFSTWRRPSIAYREISSGAALQFHSFLPVFLKVSDKLCDAFKKDGPLGINHTDYSGFSEAIAAFSEPQRKNHLISDFISALGSDMKERLGKGGLNCLEIGCRTGFHTAFLAKNFPKASFTGIDSMPDAILLANQQRKDDGEQFDNLAFIQMDPADMATEWTEKFDLVTVFDACHDQTRPDLWFKKVLRVLKPGGVFGMQDLNGSSNVFTDRKEKGTLAVHMYGCSMFHCVPILAHCILPRLDALGLGSTWGREKVLSLLKEAGTFSFAIKLGRNEDEKKIHCDQCVVLSGFGGEAAKQSFGGRMLFRALLFSTLVLYVLADDANNGITCSFCKAGLATVTATIQSNPDLQDQLGDSISVGCDQVPNELQRKACRLTLDDNFGLFFQNFLQQPGTSVEDFCKNMGYC